MRYMKTKEQKEAEIINTLSSNYEMLKTACKDLIKDIHKRYPGEELKCSFLQKIEKLII